MNLYTQELLVFFKALLTFIKICHAKDDEDLVALIESSVVDIEHYQLICKKENRQKNDIVFIFAKYKIEAIQQRIATKKNLAMDSFFEKVLTITLDQIQVQIDKSLNDNNNKKVQS